MCKMLQNLLLCFLSLQTERGINHMFCEMHTSGESVLFVLWCVLDMQQSIMFSLSKIELYYLKGSLLYVS